jgi:hypothetical protein
VASSDLPTELDGEDAFNPLPLPEKLKRLEADLRRFEAHGKDPDMETLLRGFIAEVKSYL